MSEPPSDFTNERPRGEHDITGQPRPAYDYGPDLDDERERSIRQPFNASLARVTGCLVVGLLAGASAMFIFLVVVCSR